MGNLSRTPIKILINAISAEQFGIKTGTDPKLLIKKQGLTIAKSQVGSVVKQLPTTGKKVKQRMSFAYIYDGSVTRVEFGINVVTKPFQKGEIKPIEALEIGRPYSTIMQIFNTSSKGSLGIVDKKIIADALAAQINADPYRVANGNTVVRVKNTSTADASTFTVNGSTVTLALTTNIPSGAPTGYTVTKVDTTYVDVTADTPGAPLAVVAGTDTELNDVFIDVEALSAYVRFVTTVDSDQFTVATSQKGVAPFLDARFMEREYAIKPGDEGTRPLSPVEGGTYNRYVIEYFFYAPGNTSANSQDKRSQKVYIYMLDGQEDINKFLTSDYLSDAPATVDADFTDLIAMVTP